MNQPSRMFRTTVLAAACLLGVVTAGCGGGAGEGIDVSSQSPQPTALGSGTLTVSVVDPDGRPLPGAAVTVSRVVPTRMLRTRHTQASGTVTFEELPSLLTVEVNHEFGSYRRADVAVNQQDTTTLGLSVAPNRPHPTVALLPVEVVPGSVSADRRAFTLRVTLVASPSSPFTPHPSTDPATASPALSLWLGEHLNDWGFRDCFMWTNEPGAVPACSGGMEIVHVVSSEAFSYAVAGDPPLPTPPGTARSAMLVLDQSRRIENLDPTAFRSFAARRFIERVVRSTEPVSLSLAGFAGNGGDPGTPLLLPQQPLWLPSGTGAAFSADELQLKAGIDALEPLVGGSAPVYEAIEAAVAHSSSQGPAGTRNVVIVVGGNDEVVSTTAARTAALARLREQRDATGVRSILIDAGIGPSYENAELAAALRAPRIPLPAALNTQSQLVQTMASGSNSALGLAADLIDGVALPTLSADFRLRKVSGAYAPGMVLMGTVYVETDICRQTCLEIPITFAVHVP